MLTVGQCREWRFAEATLRSNFVTVSPRLNVSSGSEFEKVVGYSRAVRIGPHVAVSGTTAAGDTIADQTRNALRRIEIALAEAGASLTDVIRTRMFVTEISRWREVGAVHAEVFGDIRPAATLVEVSALVSPELMVEIEADAYVPDKSSGANEPSGPGR
ncbi:hypothetical protein CQY20_18760 [Mycolicibacterium agri]|uniref:Enamine deaminase RidA n=1 Tax=Mycolicibacterium agri TaxID=36811 RepID=A0A2A7MZA6_MYCAG|nr:hypothetical protein CQY20_18760 [Mycolicibacterium agri]GFG49534.1 hypothetical protein MAGR_09750 [Mycolicibacterium agri]